VSKVPEIGDHESTVVSSLAGDADAIVVTGEFLISDQPSYGNLRPSVTARGDAGGVVDFHNSSTIRLDVGKVFGVFPGFVDHVSVSRIRLGEEIPFAMMREAISGDNWGVSWSKLTQRTSGLGACPAACTWYFWQHLDVLNRRIEDSDECACEPATPLEGQRPKGVIRNASPF
jgi:hypothetical protein